MNLWITITNRFGRREVSIFDVDRQQPGRFMPPKVASETFGADAGSDGIIIRQAIARNFGHVQANVKPGDVSRLWFASW